MSAQDLAKGLRTLDDESVREKVAAGDLAAAGSLDLTEEEEGLLRGAADDYPEVAGFAFDSFLTLNFTKDGSGKYSPAPTAGPGYNAALDYTWTKGGIT